MRRLIFAWLILLSLFNFISTWACTDFRLTAQDGTIMVTRSMEFAEDLQSNLMTAPRGQNVTNTTPDGKAAMAWKSKFGFVYFDGLNTGFAIDGLNEQGLSFEALYLPGDTQYQTIPAGKEKNAIAYLNFGNWLLGNFQTVDEVKAAVSNVFIYAQQIPQTKNMIFPLHFSVFDHTGKGIVIEYVKGKANIYDNTLGVMTNSPTYDWHITNLRNFINLTPSSPQPVVDSNITFFATGTGAGMHGLPGDITPPSRFVKITIMLKSVITPKNAEEILNMAQHIINNVDIPLGFVRSAKDLNSSSNELTQWVVFKDLTHKMFYYRTYQDLSLHAVDMSKLNLAENAPVLKMPITSTQYINDVTQQLQNTGNKTS